MKYILSYCFSSFFILIIIFYFRHTLIFLIYLCIYFLLKLKLSEINGVLTGVMSVLIYWFNESFLLNLIYCIVLIIEMIDNN